MNARLLKGIGTLAMAVLLPIGLAAPASTEMEIVRDPVGDSVGYDIEKLVVNHRRMVKIKVKFDDMTPYFTYIKVDVPHTGTNWKFLVTWSAYSPRKAWVDVRTDNGLQDRCTVGAREVRHRIVSMKIPRGCLRTAGEKPTKVKARASAEDDQFCPCPRDTTRWTGWANHR